MTSLGGSIDEDAEELVVDEWAGQGARAPDLRGHDGGGLASIASKVRSSPVPVLVVPRSAARRTAEQTVEQAASGQ
jgi:hypothetical protein